MNPIKTIYCAVDFSEPSKGAAEQAVRFANQLNAEALVLVHAFEPRAKSTSDGQVVEDEAAARAEAESSMQALIRGLPPVDTKVETRIVRGDPVKRIVELAQTESADVLVIATTGRRGLRRALMGSVAEGVTRASSIPVIVVRGG